MPGSLPVQLKGAKYQPSRSHIHTHEKTHTGWLKSPLLHYCQLDCNHSASSQDAERVLTHRSCYSNLSALVVKLKEQINMMYGKGGESNESQVGIHPSAGREKERRNDDYSSMMMRK